MKSPIEKLNTDNELSKISGLNREDKKKALFSFLDASNKTINRFSYNSYTIKTIGMTILASFLTLILTLTLTNIWVFISLTAIFMILTLFVWIFFDRRNNFYSNKLRRLQMYKIVNYKDLTIKEIYLMDIDYFYRRYFDNFTIIDFKKYFPKGSSNYESFKLSELFWVFALLIELVTGIIVVTI